MSVQGPAVRIPAQMRDMSQMPPPVKVTPFAMRQRLDLGGELRVVGLGQVGLAAVAGDVQPGAHEPPVGVHVGAEQVLVRHHADVGVEARRSRRSRCPGR